jgi:hypothetical protein
MCRGGSWGSCGSCVALADEHTGGTGCLMQVLYGSAIDRLAAYHWELNAVIVSGWACTAFHLIFLLFPCPPPTPTLKQLFVVINLPHLLADNYHQLPNQQTEFRHSSLPPTAISQVAGGNVQGSRSGDRCTPTCYLLRSYLPLFCLPSAV